MKGLKALAAVLVVTGLLASAAPATAGAAAYKHYVGCGISRNAKPAHVCPKKSKKGAFFKSLKGDVNYSVCVKFPSGKNLCAPSPGSEPGDALREQDHLDHPRQAPGHLVRRRQESRLLRLQGQGLEAALPLVVVGFDTATADTAACAWRDGEVLHESLLGLSADGRPRHATALLGEVERARRRGRRLGARSSGSPSASAPAPSPGCGSAIATARGLGASLGLPVSGVCTLDALGRGIGEARRAGRAPRRPRRPPRRGLRGALLGRGASGSGSRSSAGPRSWPSESPRWPRRRRPPARGRYDFGTSWPGRASRSRTMPTPCTGSPRGTSALSRRRRDGRAGPARPDLPETSRRGAVA